MDEPEQPTELDDDLRSRLSASNIDQSLWPFADHDKETVIVGDAAAGPGRESVLPPQMGNWQELALLPLPRDPNGIIGKGGQGIIYSYIQRELGREVAVKTLRPERMTPKSIENLIREACVTARLEHPNIVPVHYLHLPEHDADPPYWVMKRIRGRPLTPHLPGHGDPWPIDRLLALLRRILDAVAFAHSRGIVHRDLKPDNVLVGEFGEVQITDWGLAVAITEEGATGVTPNLKAEALPADSISMPSGQGMPPELSQRIAQLKEDVRSGRIGARLRGDAGGRAGTPAYMAPEQLDQTAETIDERTDVFLLGGILHAMLTGEPPHQLEGTDDSASLEARLGDIRDCSTIQDPRTRFDSVAALHGPVPLSTTRMQGLSAITVKALSPDPAGRYQSVQEMADALGEWESRAQSRDLFEEARTRWKQASRAGRRQTRYYAEVVALAATALEKWPANDEARALHEEASTTLTKIQHRSTVRLWMAAVFAGLVLVVGAIGYLQTRAEWLRAEEARKEAELQQRAAEENARVAESRRTEAEAERTKAETARRETERLAGLEREQREQAEAAKREAVKKSKELAQRQAQLARLVDSMHWQTYEKFAGRHDPVGQLLTAVHAQQDAAENSIESDHPWSGLAWRAARMCPRLVAVLGDEQQARRHCSALCFGPDGTLLATGRNDGSLEIMVAATGHIVATFRGHGGRISSLRFSPEGDGLASTSVDGTIRLWDAATGLETAQFGPESALASSIDFSPDGALLVSGNSDGTVTLWDATSGARVAADHAPRSVSSVQFSPDGLTLAAGCEDGTLLIRTTYGQEDTVLGREPGSVHSVSFNADGRLLAAATGAGAITIWDVAARERKTSLGGGAHQIVVLTFSAKGRQFAAAGKDGAIRLWDTSTWTETVTLRSHSDAIVGLDFSPDGSTLASASRDGTLQLWDLTGQQADLTFVGHSRQIVGLGFANDSATLVSASWDGTVRLWDVATGREKLSLRSKGSPVTCAGLSQDWKRLVLGTDEGAIELWDLVTAHRARLSGSLGPIRSICFHPGGQQFAWASADDRVWLWDVVSGGMTSIKGDTTGVQCLRFSPDGALLAMGDATGKLRLWNLLRAEEDRTLTPIGESVDQVSFAPNGTSVAAACRDTCVQLWDVQTGNRLATLGPHDSTVQCLCFSPNGKHLATGSADGTVHVWDATNHASVAVFEASSTPVTALCFGAKGRTLTCGSADGAVRLLDVSPAEPITVAQAQRLTGSRLSASEVSPVSAPLHQTWPGEPLSDSWGKRNSNRWSAGADTGDGESLHQLALIREREGRNAEARQLHQRVEGDWGAKSRERLREIPWLQPWLVSYERARALIEADDFASPQEYVDTQQLSPEDESRLTRALADHLLQLAETELANATPEAAERYSRLATALDPEDPAPCRVLGLALWAKQDAEGALEQYGRASSMERKRVEQLLTSGNEQRDTESSSENASIIETGALLVHTGVTRVGALLRWLEPPGEALSGIRVLITGERGDETAREELATDLYAAGQYQRADEALRPLLSTRSPSSVARALAALCALALDRRAEAELHLSLLAATAEPEPLTRLLARGIPLAKRLAPLLEPELQWSPKVSASLAVTYATLASLRATEGRRTEALWSCDQALAIASDSAPALAQVGRAHLALGMTGNALRQLSRAVELEPARADYQGLLGWAFYTAGRYREALTTSQTAVALNNDLTFVHATVAALHLLNRDLAQALTSCTTVADQASDGFPRAALATFHDILRKNPDLVQAHFVLGFCYEKRRDLPTARQYYAKFLEAVKEGPHAELARERLQELSE